MIVIVRYKVRPEHDDRVGSAFVHRIGQLGGHLVADRQRGLRHGHADDYHYGDHRYTREMNIPCTRTKP